MKEYRQESRTKLLNCAKEEFLAMGFEKASLRRICQKAGVTTGAVYFFFRNKEEYERTFQTWTTLANNALSRLRGVMDSDKRRWNGYMRDRKEKTP